MRHRLISMIMAHDICGGIGYRNDLPWGKAFPTDLKWFQFISRIEKDNTVLVVGNSTYKGLSFIADRNFAVLTSSVDDVTRVSDRVTMYPDITSLEEDNRNKDLLVIGGEAVYKQFLNKADIIYETIFDFGYESDTHAPDIDPAQFDLHNSVYIGNLDDSGIDAIFNVWRARANLGSFKHHRFYRTYHGPVQGFLADLSNKQRIPKSITGTLAFDKGAVVESKFTGEGERSEQTTACS